MDPTPPSWPSRFMDALPGASDAMSAWFIIFMVFLGGLAFGILFCAWQSTGAGHSLTIQQQLNLLDQRLKALESR